MKKHKFLMCALLLVLAAVLLSACAGGVEQTAEPPEQVLAGGKSQEEAVTETETEPPEQPEQNAAELVEETVEPAEEETPEETPADEKQPEPVPAKQDDKPETPVITNEADPDAEWQITLDNTSFLQAGETLVKAYGIDDTYAVAYTNTGDIGWGLNGRALLIDRQSGSVKQELYNVATDENEIPLGTLTPIRIGERILFGWQGVYTTGVKDHYYTMVNGTAKKCASIVDDTYLGDGVFRTSVRVNVNDIDLDTNPELFSQHFGWAYHTYWYFWSEDALDLREYKGIEITREELAELEKETPAVQSYIQKMEQDGYVFDNMYLRGNGILNVNFYKEQEGYRDLACGTYLYSGSAFVPYPDAEYSSTGGRYEASCWKDEYCEAVVFPPLAALRG